MYPGNTKNECLICFESLHQGMELKDFFYYNDIICSRCRGLIPFQRRKVELRELEVESGYFYEGEIRNLLLQYKELYDEALAPIFLYPIVQELKKKYRDYVMVPIPSTNTKREERGFRHVEKVFSALQLPLYDELEKVEEVQQKTRSYHERFKVRFSLKNVHSLSGKKILLVDDIITTGNSMHESARLIKPYAEGIKAFSICTHKKLLKEEL